MGQSLNCFAKTTSSVNYGKEALDDGMGDNEEKTTSSSLTLAGDFSEFPDEFKKLTYHQTEDPLSDRSEGNDGYKATFYSNKKEDKHILVHDHFISFEQGEGTYRESLIKHVMGKTIKVEGDKLVVVDPPVKTIIIYDENEPKNCGTYEMDMKKNIYIGPVRNAYFYNNRVVITDKTILRDFARYPLGTIKNDTMTIGTKPVEDPKEVKGANTGWRSSNGGIKF